MNILKTPALMCWTISGRGAVTSRSLVISAAGHEMSPAVARWKTPTCPLSTLICEQITQTWDVITQF